MRLLAVILIVLLVPLVSAKVYIIERQGTSATSTMVESDPLFRGNYTLLCKSDGTNCPASSGDNTSWNQSYADNRYYPLLSNPAGYITGYIETDPYYNRTFNHSWVISQGYLTSTPYQGGAAGWTNTTSEINTTLNVSVGTEVFFVDTTNNRVGIGTSTPTAQLTVTTSNPATGEAFRLNIPQSTTSFASTYAGFNIVNDDPTTNNFARLNFGGANTTAAAAAIAARITNHSAVPNADLTFWTRNGPSGSFVERMTIRDISGNVGIGTSAPTQSLHVVGNTNITGNITIGDKVVLYTGTYGKTVGTRPVMAFFTEGGVNETPLNGMGGVVVLTNDSSRDIFSGFGVDPSFPGNCAMNFGYSGSSFGKGSGFFNTRACSGGNSNLYFYANGSLGFVINGNTRYIGVGVDPPTERLTVAGNFSTTTGAFLATSSGNVGIGTRTPTQKLHVVGSVNITNILTLTASGVTTCNANAAGSIYYNSTTNKHYGCNSTTWNALY